MSGRVNSAALGGILTPIPTNNYFQGYMGVSGYWTTTSTSMANLTNVQGNTLTSLYTSVGFSIAAMGNSLMGIVITPPYAAAAYQIVANPSMYLGVAAQGSAIQMTDGITAFAWAVLVENATTPDSVYSPTLHGYYSGNTTGPLTIQIQGAVQSGTMTVGGGVVSSAQNKAPSVTWSIMQIA